MYGDAPTEQSMFQIAASAVPDDDYNMRTLYDMRRMIREGTRDPSVITTARHIVDGLPGRDRLAHALAIREWMETHIRFVPDPMYVEAVRPAWEMLGDIRDRFTAQGDCDEAAVLGGTLASAIGLPVDLVVVAFDHPQAPFTHVFAQVRDGMNTIDLDTTRARPNFEGRVTRSFVLPV